MAPQKSKKRKKKKKRVDDGVSLLQIVSSSANPDKRTVSNEAVDMMQNIGRSYTETGRHEGETEGEALLAMIGASMADEAVRVLAPPAQSEMAMRVARGGSVSKTENAGPSHGPH